MPSLMVPNEGEVELLGDNVAHALDGCEVLLTNADHTFDPDDVTSDYEAIEADFTGYVRGAPTWSGVTTNEVSGKAESLSSPMVFTPSSGPEQTIYGYAIISAANKCLGFEQFPAEDRIQIGAGGGMDFVVQIKFTGKSEFPE